MESFDINTHSASIYVLLYDLQSIQIYASTSNVSIWGGGKGVPLTPPIRSLWSPTLSTLLHLHVCHLSPITVIKTIPHLQVPHVLFILKSYQAAMVTHFFPMWSSIYIVKLTSLHLCSHDVLQLQ